jgi:hypothetical protein
LGLRCEGNEVASTHRQVLKKLWLTQIAIFVGNIVLLATLANMPVRCYVAYVLCGHRQASCISICCVILINTEVGHVLLVCLILGLFSAAVN